MTPGGYRNSKLRRVDGSIPIRIHLLEQNLVRSSAVSADPGSAGWSAGLANPLRGSRSGHGTLRRHGRLCCSQRNECEAQRESASRQDGFHYPFLRSVGAPWLFQAIKATAATRH
jgi:hypothetical protein